MGIVCEDDPAAGDRDFEVFPENAPIVEMFLRVSTQWRTSMAGVTGLDYLVLFQLFNVYDIKDQRQVFEGVQTMESAVLRKMGEK